MGWACLPSGRAGWRTPAPHTGQLARVKALAENNSHCLGAATAAVLAVAAEGAEAAGAGTSHLLGLLPFGSSAQLATAVPTAHQERHVEGRLGCSYSLVLLAARDGPLCPALPWTPKLCAQTHHIHPCPSVQWADQWMHEKTWRQLWPRAQEHVVPRTVLSPGKL